MVSPPKKALSKNHWFITVVPNSTNSAKIYNAYKQSRSKISHVEVTSWKIKQDIHSKNSICQSWKFFPKDVENSSPSCFLTQFPTYPLTMGKKFQKQKKIKTSSWMIPIFNIRNTEHILFFTHPHWMYLPCNIVQLQKFMHIWLQNSKNIQQFLLSYEKILESEAEGANRVEI